MHSQQASDSLADAGAEDPTIDEAFLAFMPLLPSSCTTASRGFNNAGGYLKSPKASGTSSTLRIRHDTKT